MVLLLANQDVEHALEGTEVTREIIDVIEQSFRDIADDDSARSHTAFPADLTRPKIYSIMGATPTLNAIGGCLHLRPRPAHPSHSSYKLFFDLRTSDLVCLMEDAAIHKPLVGGHVGVATRWLARPDAETVGVIGAGPVAKASLEAVCAVRQIRTVKIFSPSRDERHALADQAARRLGIEADGVETAEEAVRDVDVVTCGTNNYFRGGTRVLDADWLSPGTHVNSVSRGEIDADTARRVRVVPASLPELLAIEPPWEPYASLVEHKGIKIDADLATIVSEGALGRLDHDEVTLYTGASIGAQHTAVAVWIHSRARALGLGQVWEQAG